MPAEPYLPFAQRKNRAVRAHWRELSVRARQDDGVLSTDWLVHELGIGRPAITRAIADGLFYRVRRGVVSPQRELSPRGRMRAALIANGPDATLAGLAGCGLHGLIVLRGPVNVIVPTRRRGGREVQLDPRDVTVIERMRVLTVPRLLLDCAHLPVIDHLIHEAEVARKLDFAAIDDVLTRHAGRRGVAHLRAALARRDPSRGRTRSELERRGRRFLARHRFPPHERNVLFELGGHRIERDCWWPGQRVVLEWDGRSVHEAARALEKDKRDDSLMLAAGVATVRATWRRLEDERDLASTLWAILSSSPQPGSALLRSEPHRGP